LIVKLFIPALLLAFSLSAGGYEKVLYEKIIGSLFDKDKIVVYCDDESCEDLKGTPRFEIVEQCFDADILVGSDFIDTCDKPVFATTYKMFKKSDSIGAFYWRKGRPQLKLKEDALKKYGFKIPSKLKKYVL
jgi:hypothetical protein